MTSTATPEQRLEAARAEGRRALRDNPQRAGMYLRISRDDQGKEGVGLAPQRQEKDCRELAARLGWDVAAELYIDNDISASGKKKRPAYLRLLADIRAGKVNGVLTWHTDRLHRSPVELEDYIAACGEGSDGVPTQTVKAGLVNLATPSGRMIARMLGAVARYELEHTVERIDATLKHIREAGGAGGGPRPFGFHRDGPSIKRGGQGRLAHVPAEAAAITRAYRDVLAGVSTYAIAREWNEAGLRTTVKAKPWDAVHVRRVLCRAVNAGLIEIAPRDAHGMAQAPQIAGRGNWEPIVSEDTWRAVRGILTDPARRTGPGPRPRALLTGVLICGRCGGRTFVVQRPNISKARTYVCKAAMTTPGAVAGPRCALARNANLLDAYVEEHLIGNPEKGIIGMLGTPEVVAAVNTRPEIDIPALDARRTEINSELGEIAALRFTVRQRAEMSAPLLDELAEVEDQISSGLRGDALPEFAGQDPAAVWAHLKETGNIERMRAIVGMLLRVRLHPTRGRRRGRTC